MRRPNPRTAVPMVLVASLVLALVGRVDDAAGGQPGGPA
jgi:hypothetical protein